MKEKVEDFIVEQIPNIVSVKPVDSFRDRYGTLIDSGLLFTSKEGYKLLLNHSEDSAYIEIYTIYGEPQGTGLGSKIMNVIKLYSDYTMKPIRVYKVRNERFFEKMGFDVRGGGVVMYRPQYRPR